MLAKVIKHVALQKARAYNIPLELAEQALWDAIDMRDEIANHYPG